MRLAEHWIEAFEVESFSVFFFITSYVHVYNLTFYISAAEAVHLMFKESIFHYNIKPTPRFSSIR